MHVPWNVLLPNIYATPPETEWPPVNGHFADVYRLASWRLLTPLETVAALDYETLTASSWDALPDDQREAWFEHVRGTILVCHAPGSADSQPR
ncbi:hypothetical protein GCM10020255_003130 [Rhodococcus baikonurensis]